MRTGIRRGADAACITQLAAVLVIAAAEWYLPPWAQWMLAHPWVTVISLSLLATIALWIVGYGLYCIYLFFRP